MWMADYTWRIRYDMIFPTCDAVFKVYDRVRPFLFSILARSSVHWGATSLLSNVLVILSTLACTLASVAQWGRLSHMITVELMEASYSFTAPCVSLSLLSSFHPPNRSVSSKKPPLINTRCAGANLSCRKTSSRPACIWQHGRGYVSTQDSYH